MEAIFIVTFNQWYPLCLCMQILKYNPRMLGRILDVCKCLKRLAISYKIDHTFKRNLNVTNTEQAQLLTNIYNNSKIFFSVNPIQKTSYSEKENTQKCASPTSEDRYTKKPFSFILSKYLLQRKGLNMVKRFWI